MIRYALFVLIVVTMVAGCGGGTPGVDDGGNPPDPVTEWTFTPGNTSTIAVWSDDRDGSDMGGISAVLRGDGQVQIISIGGTQGISGITGTATGTVNADGSFTIAAGTMHASGTVTHQSADLTVSPADNLAVIVPMSSSITPAASYSSYKGTWTGTYKMSDDVEHPLSFTVNEAGFITGTISEGAAAGTLYGRADASAGTITLTIPYLNGSQPGWKFSTVGEIKNNQVSGSITSHDLLDPATGTWTVGTAVSSEQ